jgi:hypothetical protein
MVTKMRDATNVHIREMIIHILDPRGQGLVLSDVVLPLAGNQELMDYFTRHIQGALSETTTNAARFRNINPAQPSGICQALISGQINLVSGSQRLAQALHRILENDQRISSADLGVCFYQAENYPGMLFLAILKIDPSQVFRHVVHQVNGHQYISFEAESRAFTNERLQKSAFIQPLEPRHPDFDMLLMDRQVRGLDEGRIARFFSQTFLDAEEAFDPRKYTDRLNKSLIQAQNSIRTKITPQQGEDLDTRIRQALTSQRLNLDAWLNALPLPNEIKQEIDEIIRNKIPDREFDLDQSFSEALVSKIRFQGDYNLKIEIPTAHQHEIIVSEEHIANDPERGPYYQIVIRTEIWRKIP